MGLEYWLPFSNHMIKPVVFQESSVRRQVAAGLQCSNQPPPHLLWIRFPPENASKLMRVYRAEKIRKTYPKGSKETRSRPNKQENEMCETLIFEILFKCDRLVQVLLKNLKTMLVQKLVLLLTTHHPPPTTYHLLAT